MKGWLEMAKLKSNLGEVIKSKGYMKGWVAEQVGVSKTQMSSWCNHKEDGSIKSMPSALNARMLMDILNCEFDDIFEVIKDE